MTIVYWILPSEGEIEQRTLTEEQQRGYEERGWERFTIGRGARPPWVGFAENPADVGRLRLIMLNNDERYGHAPE